jgi:hypothetical protein
MKRLFVLVIISYFLVQLPINFLSAHTTTAEPWILLNGEEIDDNEFPKTSKLIYASHKVEEFFNINDVLTFQINLDVIEDEFDVDKRDLKIDTRLYDAYEKEISRFNTSTIMVQATKTGTYFLKIEIFENSKEVLSEIIGYSVGEKFDQSEFIIDNFGMKQGQTIWLVLDRDHKVYVRGNDDFIYKWDIGVNKEFIGEEFTMNIKERLLPFYLTLRTINKKTNVAVDTYVKIDTDSENKFEIPMPGVPLPNNMETHQTSARFLIGLLVALFALLFLVRAWKSGIISRIKKKFYAYLKKLNNPTHR